ncbi:MAG: 16S rRNA (adenine(1518)-N(6)/adenine(1519)-N(6))-dimethyltransferase RsmA [Candidatus Omnitrophota bacterium]|nr:16S rRNA (adenine(1518)-N(6)/adenine(1519)-N(6))-dimethyltransferase RsmA [Candidatus Omnitrophota bacterium]
MKRSLDPAVLRPRKWLSQNFLKDPNIIRKIMEACDLKKDDRIFEIGPGKGALTKELIPSVESITAVEKDSRLAQHLQTQFFNTNLTVINNDILEFPFESLVAPMKGIGNLPYHIASPIIERIMIHRKKFSVFYMTVQLEHGLRMIAQPSSRDYSAFSCFVQYYAQAEKLFTIRNTSFDPAPKVQSCFLKLLFRKNPVTPAADEDFLFSVIHTAFQQRRKTILNALQRLADKSTLQGIFIQCQIPGQARAENLDLKQFVDLSNRLGIALKKKMAGI